MTKDSKSEILGYINEDGSLRENLDELLFRHVDFCQAFLFAELLFPRFLIVEDSVLVCLGDHSKMERFSKILMSSNKSRIELESSFNLIEVAYIFNSYFGITDSMEERLSRALQFGWSAKLRQDFPDRQFVVEVFSPVESGSVWSISFHQSR